MTKVYIAMEVSGEDCGGPGDMEASVLGVFSRREDAERYIENYVSYDYSEWGVRLSVTNGNARDEHGNLIYQVIERDLL